MEEKTTITNKKKDLFESKIKPLLLYIGTIGAIIMVIAYIILICILIFGFKQDIELKKALVIAIVNAVVGMLVMVCLKIQGRDFAKNLQQNKPIIKAYYKNKTKDKKIRSMKYFWIKTSITDFIFKAVTVIISTTLVIRLVISGSDDAALLGIAAVNILMFICFGFIALVRAYDFYNEYHVQYMINELEKVGISLKIDEKNAIISTEDKEESTNGNN